MFNIISNDDEIQLLPISYVFSKLEKDKSDFIPSEEFIKCKELENGKKDISVIFNQGIHSIEGKEFSNHENSIIDVSKSMVFTQSIYHDVDETLSMFGTGFVISLYNKEMVLTTRSNVFKERINSKSTKLDLSTIKVGPDLLALKYDIKRIHVDRWMNDLSKHKHNIGEYNWKHDKDFELLVPVPHKNDKIDNLYKLNPLTVQLGEVKEGDRVIVIGFANQLTRKEYFNIEGNTEDSYQIYLRLFYFDHLNVSVGSVKEVTKNLVSYDANTCHGMKGSPVFKLENHGKLKLVGMHVGGDRSKESNYFIPIHDSICSKSERDCCNLL
jgi:hypothetical protein